MELESELRALAAQIDWPETPTLRLRLEPKRRSWRRPLLVAVAVSVVGLAAAFAIPQSRGAILRFFGFGAVRVEFVSKLPAAQERPLGSDLGRAVSPPAARQLLGQAPLLPPLASPPPLHASDRIVSLLFVVEGAPVLLSEMNTGSGVFLKKIAGAGTVQWVQVGSEPALWFAGGQHVVVFPQAPPRLAGHVLVWQQGKLTLRLEGANLTLAEAKKIAGELR
jgi:hypothetical protein